MILLSVLIGVLDGLGLTMFLPLLQMADGNSGISGEGMGSMGFLIKGLQHLGIELNIKSALLFMFVFFVLKGMVYYTSLKFNVKILQYFISSMRMKLTNLFTKYSFQKFVTADVGRIQNSFTSEIYKVSIAYKNFTENIQNIILVMVYLVFVFLVDWRFAFLVCVGGGFSNLLFGRLFKRTKKQSNELSQNNNHYHSLIMQFVTNFKYLKATGYVTDYANRLKVKSQKWKIITPRLDY